ncbi:YeiH family protein [Halostella pelagica]|uniref:YeiH family protein n=1 Tax=Halostella pelagica TaxID=2583824 RepID=UPI001080D41D|nr:putative sulfate exporter family transporter [Halostella pelagica]
MNRVRRLLPGLVVLLSLGFLARGITMFAPIGSHLIVVIGLGVIIANSVGVPDWAKPGVETHSLLLAAGIVLMGATVGLEQIIDAGGTVLLVVGTTVCVTVVTVETLSREIFDIPEKIGSLLAVGSSICGVSAVAAVAGSIKPDQQDIAYAVATVLLFDAVTLAAYPMIGRVLGLSDVVFGIWAGATMFSTGPVTAAGFAHSEVAGEWAVLVKLTRNALIGVIAIGYALYYARRGGAEATIESKPVYLWRTFPKFILGFVLMMVLGSVGVFSNAQTTAFDTASTWLFLVAFAGLGLSIDVREFRDMGIKPVGVVLTSLLLVSTVVLLVLLTVF